MLNELLTNFNFQESQSVFLVDLNRQVRQGSYTLESTGDIFAMFKTHNATKYIIEQSVSTPVLGTDWPPRFQIFSAGVSSSNDCPTDAMMYEIIIICELV